MQPNGLVNLLVKLPPALNIVRRKPAAHAFGLQIGMEPLGKLLVVGGIADEAGVVLDGPSHHRADISDELVGHAASAEENFGNLAIGFVDGVNADAGWSIVLDGFESFSTYVTGFFTLLARYVSGCASRSISMRLWTEFAKGSNFRTLALFGSSYAELGVLRSILVKSV